MLDRSLETEFASYRKTLSTDEARRAFDERIERLLKSAWRGLRARIRRRAQGHIIVAMC